VAVVPANLAWADPDYSGRFYYSDFAAVLHVNKYIPFRQENESRFSNEPFIKITRYGKYFFANPCFAPGIGYTYLSDQNSEQEPEP
jgi:hypothetical protein